MPQPQFPLLYRGVGSHSGLTRFTADPASAAAAAAGRDIGSNLPALLEQLVAVLPADGRTMLRVGMTNPVRHDALLNKFELALAEGMKVAVRWIR